MTFFEFIRYKLGIAPKPKSDDIAEIVEDSPYSTHRIFRYANKDAMDAVVFPNRNAVEKMHEMVPLEMAMDSGSSVVNRAFDVKKLFSVGGSRMPDLLLGWYARQGFIGYQACAVLSQNWLINKACETPPRDAARNGWKLVAADEIDETKLDELMEHDNKYNIAASVLQFSKMSRVFGIRIAIFKVDTDDPLYYERKFNIDAIKPDSYLGIAQVDPYWCVPELKEKDLSDPASINFYDPEYWIIGGVRYHKSHLCVLRYAEVPDILKPAYLYGGVSLVQMIYERVYCAERSANESPQLLMTKRLNVEKVNLKQMVADPYGFQSRVEDGIFLRDNYGIKFIGKDDDYMQHETSLAEVPDAIMMQFQLVASIAGMPATKLIEVQPRGFNSTGDYEKTNYRQVLKSIQIHEMDELLEKHYMIQMKSEHGISTDTIRIKWNPTDDPTAAEIAELNNKVADYYNKLQDTGAIAAVDIAEALNHDDNSGFANLSTDEADYENPLEDMFDLGNEEADKSAGGRRQSESNDSDTGE